MKRRAGKTSPRLLLVLVLAITGGCRTTWVNLDNSPAEEAQLREAELACDVAEKRDSMDQAEARKNQRLKKARSNESTMLVKEDFALEVQSIQAEIDSCMRQQGLRKSD